MGANNAAYSKTLGYDYNLDGSLKALHYPSGAMIVYTPDSAGRILSAVDTVNNINYVPGASYGPNGSLTGYVNGSGGPGTITSSFSYNKRLQPVTMSATTVSQTVFSIGYDFHLGNGNNGNVWGIYNYKDHTRDQSFAYDALNRLASAQNAGTDCNQKVLQNKTEYWGNSYTYDAWGNLLGKSVTKCGAENLDVTADAHNWIHAGGTDYQYDAAGNMTFNVTAPTQTYSYDQENRLTGAAGYFYTYDGDGNRVRKSNGTTPASGTLYWYMTPGVVAESDLAGTLKSEYVFFDGERVARKDFAGGTTSVAYYFSDHLKTASIITDASGTITAESDYYPWGGELQFVANDSNDYKFTGKKRDTETGLDYFGARYYSNGLGRWISADWSATPVPVPYADLGDPQSLNLYGYVRGLPTTRVDVNGHEDKSLWENLKEAIVDFLTAGQPHGAPQLPPPKICGCPIAGLQQQNDSKQNNNSSQSKNNEQGRDAKGRFTSKQAGQSAPGSGAEKEGLESVGAVKNKNEILNGTKRDGTIPETGQHVEVKSGQSISNTEQLQNMGQAAMDRTGKPLKVVTTNPNSNVSGPAQKNSNLQIEPKEK